MDRSPLTANEVVTLDTRLPDWACDGASLARDFTFADFAEALRIGNADVGEEDLVEVRSA